MNSGKDRIQQAESAISEALDYIFPGDRGQKELKRLIALHGSPGAVLESSPQLLIEEGLSEENALLLSLVPGLIRHTDHARWGNHPILDNLLSTSEYMRLKYVGANVENYHLLALDSSGRLIECVHLHTGNENSVPFYLKKVMSAVLSTNAEALVLTHNHPSCAARPSLADIECTEKLMRAVSRIGAPLLDHIIMISGHALSIRGFGYIKPEKWLSQDEDSYILRHWLDNWDMEEAAAALESCGR